MYSIAGKSAQLLGNLTGKQLVQEMHMLMLEHFEGLSNYIYVCIAMVWNLWILEDQGYL